MVVHVCEYVNVVGFENEKVEFPLNEGIYKILLKNHGRSLIFNRIKTQTFVTTNCSAVNST